MIRKILLIILFSFGTLAHAQYFQLDLMKKRQSNKESSRWTLADWLSQKQKISLWDNWLAMNRSANFFEMQASGSQFDYDYTSNDGSGEVKITETSHLYSLDLWFSIFGLRGEYEKRDSGLISKTGLFNLRLIGTSLQSTHLQIRGGVQTLENPNTNEKWENPVADALLKMYFLSFIGLHGDYRHFFPKESNLGAKREGSRVRAGAFIEIGAIHLSGTWWKEPIETTRSGTITKQEREGYELGVSLIF